MKNIASKEAQTIIEAFANQNAGNAKALVEYGGDLYGQGFQLGMNTGALVCGAASLLMAAIWWAVDKYFEKH